MCLEKLLSNNDCIWEEILTEPLKLKSYYKKILLKEMKILFTVEDNESKHSWTPVLDI